MTSERAYERRRRPEETTATTVGPQARLARESLAFARKREYTGWDYGDGMSSRIRQALPVDNRWLNLVFQESIKRAPVNIRPLLLVEQRRSYMGAALFALANLSLAAVERTGVDTGEDVDYVSEAVDLSEWLVANRSTGYSGYCGGHQHEVQHLHGRGVPNTADVVSTSFAVRALLATRGADPELGEVAQTASRFVLDDLEYTEVDTGATIRYVLSHEESSYTINAGALCARLLLDIYAATGDVDLLERATALLDHIASLQQSVGGWMYRDPPEASHLSMDNHHNAFIIETFLWYHEVTGGERYDVVLDRAMAFFRETLFEDSGAPNWDEEQRYPKDVHACANGILVFAYAGEYDFAERILEWTLENLYAGDGRFYYRKQRYYTKRTTLMRWCQAWMSFAVAELARERVGAPPPLSPDGTPFEVDE
jgi:hypothetical protein